MIVVRNVFQLKFGKAKEAMALWKEGSALMKRGGMVADRLLTDVTGPYYTLVMESSHKSLADLEQSVASAMTDEWRRWYERFVPLVESGHREVLRVVD